MTKPMLIVVFTILALAASTAQDNPTPETDSTPVAASTASVARGNDAGLPGGPTNSSAGVVAVPDQNRSEGFGIGSKFRYYLGETYLNPSFVTAPAFSASIRMANPPGHFPTAYPPDWRQGAAGFGRNYADAIAQRVSFQTARFATGVLIREDPRYAHPPATTCLHGACTRSATHS